MLKIENVCVSYDNNQQVLNDICMDFDQETPIGIIGANGSGKSTLFQTIVGLLKPTKGNVYFEDKVLDYRKKSLNEFRKRIGIVFQEPEQQMFYSIVEDDVAFALKNLAVPDNEIVRRMNKAFDVLDIQHLKHRPIQYLSYGQKKRVAIASVLVLETEWLLLDEPTAGLDPAGRSHMIHIIKRLISENKKVILSSHDMDLMYDVCEYLYVINKGSVIAEGSKEMIFLNRDLLLDAKLEQPWLVKMHQQLGIPLYPNETTFYENTTVGG
ncbi:TPA: energy-coupling factor ABC transporter ATP-binding protein [Enterococcus faecalis]|uniref:energy-coupling factor ABC transporter ATP-binding protein n=1 Tax=Enterococcus faecalis TaxID=1351 RepID=UPI0011430960|nr:ATP-binding cassette domain-containing protein [Enterococcus faecalis]EHV0153394.1 ATP-binding cassette domain-containing protein [Enterococcus faecalis]NSV46807.1 ATP-binding cassette domain-containing protein [Enterococcus faecalis]TQA42046.1 ATP-binding cassette domain-containing protein [Enterococcus faecalis]HDT8169901.1 ATP-binding cassette domain-containing protein [Enterococcus faecalis]